MKYPLQLRGKVREMFLLLRFDCGMFSPAAALEGAGITLDMENPTPGQEAWPRGTGGCSSGPTERNEWGKGRNKVWPLMTLTIQFGFCSWVLVTSLGLGGDQTHQWFAPSVCNDGFCPLGLCIFYLCYRIENQIISTEQHPERGDRGEICIKQTEL